MIALDTNVLMRYLVRDDVQQADAARAAFRYRASGAGFSDLMILAAAERSGAQPLYTFDQKAARLEGVSLL